MLSQQLMTAIGAAPAASEEHCKCEGRTATGGESHLSVRWRSLLALDARSRGWHDVKHDQPNIVQDCDRWKGTRESTIALTCLRLTSSAKKMQAPQLHVDKY